MSCLGRLQGSRWLGHWLGCRCRLGQTWARRIARSESPRTIEFAHGRCCKEAEQPTRKIQTTVRTAYTLVHNLSLTSFALVIDGYHLKAVGSAVILRFVQGNNIIIARVIRSTSTHPGIVERKPSIVKPFLKLSQHLASAPLRAGLTSMTPSKR